ncbi:MAG: Rpn family recombination-promoting nuclease/putative transposase [Treponema sp.]|nr:Rpn family recombination-promoting nuclease/putative transposase [Candidatus Treponema equifaecale]
MDDSTRKRKTVDELEFADDFMFSTVMQNPEICKGVLERLLKMKISKIEYPEAQKTISPFFNAKGVRLDVYCESDGKVYDVEMQNSNYTNLPKRARYYQSMLDSEQLNKGKLYENLKESFIIFICKTDPFHLGVPIYRVDQIFRDVKDKNGNPAEYKDDVQKFFFNSAAYEQEKDSALRNFLKFVHTSKPDDDFTEQLDEQVRETKERDIFRSSYMEWNLTYHDAKLEGRIEGLAEGESKAKLESAKIAIKEGLTKELVLKISGISCEQYEELTGTLEKNSFLAGN